MNIEFALRLGAALFEMGAQAFAAAKGDERAALKLIKDRTQDIAALERDNDKRARELVLGTNEEEAP